MGPGPCSPLTLNSTSSLFSSSLFSFGFPTNPHLFLEHSSCPTSGLLHLLFLLVFLILAAGSQKSDLQQASSLPRPSLSGCPPAILVTLSYDSYLSSLQYLPQPGMTSPSSLFTCLLTVHPCYNMRSVTAGTCPILKITAASVIIVGRGPEELLH